MHQINLPILPVAICKFQKDWVGIWNWGSKSFQNGANVREKGQNQMIRFSVATWAWLWSLFDYLVRNHYRQIQLWVTALGFVHFPTGPGPQKGDLRPTLLQTFWVYMSSNWQGLHLILITKVLQGRPTRHFTHQTALTEQCFDEIITNESEEVNYPWNNNTWHFHFQSV